MSKTTETQVVTGMMKSHAEALAEAEKHYPKVLVADYEVRGTEEIVENGRIMKKSCVKKVHPQDNFKGLTPDDFALENIMAVGALDSLREGYLHINNTSELSDAMEGSIDNMINAVDEAEASTQTNNGGNE